MIMLNQTKTKKNKEKSPNPTLGGMKTILKTTNPKEKGQETITSDPQS